MSDLRVCLLTDQDLDALLARDPANGERDWPCDPRPFLPEARWEVATLERATAPGRVRDLAREGFDVFFNLCDGAWEEARPGIEVVHSLERADVPFTGADSSSYEPSREAMKRVCAAWDVGTPGSTHVHGPGEAERTAELLGFPLIVKHPESYASVGLTPDSRVRDLPALRRQIERMTSRFGGALVERFVDGDEYTVLVAETPGDPDAPTTWTPLRYTFPPGESFKHERLKWEEYAGLEAAPLEDGPLARELREASARLFRGLGGVGYGRCDLRVDADGRLHMLEINPNCGLYYPPSDPGSADLILLREPDGHTCFTRQVVDAALARHRMRQRPWAVRVLPDGRGGLQRGLVATRRVRPGETLLAFEEAEHRLVSRSRVEAGWGPRETGWFRRYAWPLTEEVWVVWSRDPEDWKPVNHACEPTAWLEGLDVVARLPLEPGEEITLDYATYSNELMPDFPCSCGAASCRGVIRGTDHRVPEIVDRYGEHVSDYVRRKRAGCG